MFPCKEVLQNHPERRVDVLKHLKLQKSRNLRNKATVPCAVFEGSAFGQMGIYEKAPPCTGSSSRFEVISLSYFGEVLPELLRLLPGTHVSLNQ